MCAKAMQKIVEKKAFGSQGCVWPKERRCDLDNEIAVIIWNSQPSAVDGLKCSL